MSIRVSGGENTSEQRSRSGLWCNSLNWIYLNDEDVFLQFPILIRILELISVSKHSRDSLI